MTSREPFGSTPPRCMFLLPPLSLPDGVICLCDASRNTTPHLTLTGMHQYQSPYPWVFH